MKKIGIALEVFQQRASSKTAHLWFRQLKYSGRPPLKEQKDANP